MSRPKYETGATLDEERKIGGQIAAVAGCDMFKLPLSYQVDFIFLKDKRPTAFVEIKDRQKYARDKIDALGGYMLSLQKWLRARSLCEPTGIPFLIGVRFADGVYVATIKDWDSYIIRMGGRRDRGDWQDVEPMAMIPVSEFKPHQLLEFT